jgi:hypothetical protein
MWLCVERGNTTVVANLGDGQETVPHHADRPRRTLLASDAGVRVGEDRVEMPPVSVVFLGR